MNDLNLGPLQEQAILCLPFHLLWEQLHVIPHPSQTIHEESRWHIKVLPSPRFIFLLELLFLHRSESANDLNQKGLDMNRE